MKSSATPPDDTSATGQGRSSVDSGRERGAAGVNPDHRRPSDASLDRARRHRSSRIRPQVAAAPAAPPPAAPDRATRGIVMCAGRMTAASANGYIVVSRGQLWHRRPVRRIEAHLDPSFTTESPSAFQTSCHWRDARGWVKLPARITAPMIANGLVRGVLPALGQLQTPATIPHSDRLSKEFRRRRSGLPVRVIRARAWLDAAVSVVGVGC